MSDDHIKKEEYSPKFGHKSLLNSEKYIIRAMQNGLPSKNLKWQICRIRYSFNIFGSMLKINIVFPTSVWSEAIEKF